MFEIAKFKSRVEKQEKLKINILIFSLHFKAFFCNLRLKSFQFIFV